MVTKTGERIDAHWMAGWYDRFSKQQGEVAKARKAEAAKAALLLTIALIKVTQK